MKKKIYNGVPWFDQEGSPVNAHGACILKEHEKYYLFGEYKTNKENKYIGFSCYSTENFTDWTFEGLALPPQKEGLLGPDRIGERVKVLKCPSTGKYVMLMHTDDLKYCDPCIGLAVSDNISGPFTFLGPLLFKGQPVRKWDMGTFTDDDGTAYLLTHEGNIYRLSNTYTEAVELTAENIAPGGESPAMFKANGTYFIMFSNKTSWERNDNYYLTAQNPKGPWNFKGLFCPKGSLTHNSQCSFVFEYEKAGAKLPIYVGDRWSFPKQASAATLILLPITVSECQMSIPQFLSAWCPDTLEAPAPVMENGLHFRSHKKGETCCIPFHGSRIMLYGKSDVHGGYGNIEILNSLNEVVHNSTVDFYSLVPDENPKYLSPVLQEGDYTLKVTITGTNGIYFSKNGTRFGSDDFYVEIMGYSLSI